MQENAATARWLAELNEVLVVEIIAAAVPPIAIATDPDHPELLSAATCSQFPPLVPSSDAIGQCGQYNIPSPSTNIIACVIQCIVANARKQQLNSSPRLGGKLFST